MWSVLGSQRCSVSRKGGKACVQTTVVKTYTSCVLKWLDFSKHKHLKLIDMWRQLGHPWGSLHPESSKVVFLCVLFVGHWGLHCPGRFQWNLPTCFTGESPQGFFYSGYCTSHLSESNVDKMTMAIFKAPTCILRMKYVTVLHSLMVSSHH